MKTIDYDKRRRVMKRSQELGHCICDTRRPCPCDVYRDQGICPCAGERPEPMELSQVRLTELVHNTGCASKIAPGDLEAVLSRLPEVSDPAVVSGLAAADDAGIYRISDDLHLVQTVDVFTPCVDDPLLFGRICAANCLSDIYAMGGEPRTALSVLCFPTETLHGEIMHRLLAGAMETLAEANVALIGGHSIKDSEIKLGFAITGTIDPKVAEALDRPRAGDWLVLTKPLGTGVLTFAHQIGKSHQAGLAEATASMTSLNKDAAEAMRQAGASAGTDITGFGLFGHLIRLLRQKKLGARLFAEALPAFDGAVELLREGVIPGAVERNREFVGSDLEVEPGVDEACLNLGFDAQTSGGLLIAVPAEQMAVLKRALARNGAGAFVIGRITAPAVKPLVVTHSSGTEEGIHAAEAEVEQAPQQIMKDSAPGSLGQHDGCCADVFGHSAAQGSSLESQRAYGALMRSVQGAGKLTEKTKELLMFGLVVSSRCEPCFEAHYRKAREMGISQAELDEVAWCAIAMGGAPVRMFYQACLERAQRATA